MSNIKNKNSVVLIKKGDLKFCRSAGYNYDFNMVTGQFARWGNSFEHDPDYAPFPEILDIEVTEVCAGPLNRGCPFCYKSNNLHGRHMSLEQFKSILDKMPWLTQTALGADAQGTTNPELFDMMAYARSKGIIPNLTIAEISDEVADKLVAVAGAVAVSVYKHAGVDVAYDSIKRLTDRGMKQVNIHLMVSVETLDHVKKVLSDVKTDPRLEKLNAVVMLGLKQKGRGVKFKTVTSQDYKELVEYCLDNGVPFGFDSCSAPSFVESIIGHPNETLFKTLAEDCESTLFSSYIGVDGCFYPCSFTEKESSWSEGISVLEAEDFIKDVWNHPRTIEFRNNLLQNKDHNGCRNCPVHVVCGKDMRCGEFKPQPIGDIL